MMLNMRRFFAASAAVSLTLTASALAQKDLGTTTPTLNQQQADAAARQNADNVANAATYDAARAEYAAQSRAAAEAQAAYAAEVARVNQARAAYEAAYRQWQADVAACNAGNRARCARPAPAPQ